MTEGWRRRLIGIMTTAILAAFVAVLVHWPGRAAVPAGEQLFQKDGCAVCHAVDHKLVGPSYDDVAKKFAGQQDAVPTLVDAIKKGHVGTWGAVPMPAHPNLSDSEIKQIVDWILSLK